MSNPPDSDERQVRPFAAILNEIASGRFHNTVSEQLADVTAAVAQTGKKGTLTVTLTVEPVKGARSKTGLADTLAVSGKFVAKAPDVDPAASVFFADDGGNLTRNDPNQPALPIRGLTTPTEATA